MRKKKKEIPVDDTWGGGKNEKEGFYRIVYHVYPDTSPIDYFGFPVEPMVISTEIELSLNEAVDFTEKLLTGKFVKVESAWISPKLILSFEPS